LKLPLNFNGKTATASMTGWDADDSMDIDLDVCFSMTDKIEKAMTSDLKHYRSCMEVVS